MILRPASVTLTAVVRAIGVLAAVTLSYCACAQGAQLSRCKKAVMTYKYPGKHGLGEQYQGAKWWRVNTEYAPKAATPMDTKRAHQKHTSTYELASCSNKEFACLRTYQWVFAVPVGVRTPGATYEFAGASLKIMGCVQDKDQSCRTVLVTSDCRSLDGSRGARQSPGEIIGNNCRSSGWGLKMIFLFDRDRGVIAYEDAGEMPEAMDLSKWDLSTLGVSAGMRALVEPKGLLSCELSTTN